MKKKLKKIDEAGANGKRLTERDENCWRVDRWGGEWEMQSKSARLWNPPLADG